MHITAITIKSSSFFYVFVRYIHKYIKNTFFQEIYPKISFICLLTYYTYNLIFMYMKYESSCPLFPQVLSLVSLFIFHFLSGCGLCLPSKRQRNQHLKKKLYMNKNVSNETSAKLYCISKKLTL